MSVSNKSLFFLEQAADIAKASQFLRQFNSTGLWKVSDANGAATRGISPLIDSLMDYVDNQQSGSKQNSSIQYLAIDHDGAAHLPLSLASFAARPAKPSIIITSLIKEMAEKDKEAMKLGLSLIARGCFFNNSSAFEALESLVDDLVKMNKVDVMINHFAGTQYPVESPIIQALKQATSLPMSSCVALGTVKEAEIARAMGLCPPAMVGRLSRLLKELALPNKFDRKVIDTVGVRLSLSKILYSSAKNGVVDYGLPLGTFQSKQCQVPVQVIERVVADALTVVPFALNESNKSCSVRVPGSKSVSNRALLLAGLSEGSCVVRGLLHSDDTQVMMCALEQLGASFTWIEGGAGLLVKGNGGKFATPTKPLWMGNAGTATRFVISLCALVNDPNAETTLEGSHRMEERPQADLVDALVANGTPVKYLKKPGHLPLVVKGGGFKGGVMTLSGKISSQFVSSVLFASPYAKEPLELTLLEAEPTSISYIEMTLDTMAEFGVKVERLAKNKFRVPNNQGYRAPAEYFVEADASSATYALACASVYPGRSVTVLGVGSNSLQGDAQFCQFLGRMGAGVQQTKDSSTVTGSASLHPPHAPGKTEDMASLTDAFLTGVACAAVCPKGSTTHISGIANQHVKECDRIAALVKELGKFGIKCENLSDGIVVHGEGPNQVPEGEVYLDTYDDHRVAMSLAVIGTRVPNLVISDKDCTDKTYPDFWDDLVNCLKTEVRASPKLPEQWTNQSLVLIGMRGAGKTTLGKKAAAHLDWKLIDLDEVLTNTANMPSCRAIVEKFGWDGFRKLEFECLVKTLQANPTRHVIACGGGIVEYAQSRQALKEWFPVINIQRDFADIELVLRPASQDGATAASISQDSPNKKSKLDAQKEDDPNRPRFDEPIEDVWARRRPWLTQCATYDFVVPLSGSIAKLAEDWPMIEMDFARLLDNCRNPASPDCSLFDESMSLRFVIDPSVHTSAEDVKQGLAQLRRQDEHRRMVIVQLSKDALEKLDVDQQLDLLRGTARTGCEGWIMPPKSAWKQAATVRGRALSLFGPVRLAEEDGEGEWFKASALAYPGKAWFLPPAEKMYYLFGNPVFASPSPTMHNTAFKLFSHAADKKRFTIFNTWDADRVNAAIFTPTFAGASVTIPHKQNIQNLNYCSKEAKSVGAINTVFRGPNGELYGDNTDWIGIKKCLLLQGQLPKDGSVLVIGAGGTARAACYCIREMGLKLFLYNRTQEKAVELAREFNGKTIGLGEPIDKLCAIVSTVPATSKWTAPSAWLESKPLVFDVAYRPRRTALLNQAADAGCFTVEGIQLLLEQGYEQMKRFQIGTSDKAALEKVTLSKEFLDEIQARVYEFYEKSL